MVLQFRGDRHVDAIPGSRDGASRHDASRHDASRHDASRDVFPRNDDAKRKECTSNLPPHEHTHQVYGSLHVHTSDISVYLVHGKSSKYSPNNSMRLSTECRIEQST